MDIKITEELPVKNNEKKVIGTQIPHDLYCKLKDDAENEFMSISDLLRKIIFTYYKNRKEQI